jgi:opacity protein-like surface antigen
VGGGLGIYFLQARSSGESIGDSETKVGATIFGGVELFTSQTLAIKGELRYHLIGNTDAGLNPDGATLTIGVKKYF